MGLTLGWKAPCSELKGPECGSSGGMPGMVGGYEGKNWETQKSNQTALQTGLKHMHTQIHDTTNGNTQIGRIFDLPNAASK